MTRNRLLSPLGLRLAAAFVTVAIAAVVVFAVLTVTSAQRQLNSLVIRTHTEDAQAAAVAAAQAYQEAGGWTNADLTSVLAVAARGQATLTVLDPSGKAIAVPANEAQDMLAGMHGVEVVDVPRGQPVRAPVVVNGQTVGSIELRFPASHLPSPEEGVREALLRTAVLGAIVAVATAVAVSFFVAQRVSGPIAALTDAAAEIEAGHRGVRVDLTAPGEIGTLAAAFDRMSTSLEREDELRRQLVRDVAHEVRTPLSILQGTTEALVDGVMPADADTLASLHDEVLRLSRLVGDLETLAAAEAASLHLEVDPLDLAEVGAAAAELAGPAATLAELALETDLEPAPTTGDAGRLRQVAMNLVANAFRYTPAGGTVTVRTALDDGEAVLEVLDTGPGIAPEDLPRLFERFYRGRAAEDVAGSGIGLAVAAELVAAHGGRIEAGDRDGGGARFTVRLPARA
ncbi:MAG: sensor histidine kinase [Planctomycetaceae bacterium]